MSRRHLPPLDLAASSSWPDLDTSAGPQLDLSTLPPLDITAGPQLDLSADLIPVDLNADLIAVDLNAEMPAGRPEKRRPGKSSTGRKKPVESAEKGRK